MLISKVCGFSRTSSSFLLKQILTGKFMPVFSVSTTTAVFSEKKHVGPIGEHAKLFKIEKTFAAASLPLIPISYFVHGHTMDYVLIAAIVLNAHWGGHAVVTDYARAAVVGEKFAAIAPNLVYLMSALLLAGLLHFEYNDVGLTRAFELVFSL